MSANRKPAHPSTSGLGLDVRVRVGPKIVKITLGLVTAYLGIKGLS